MQGIAAIGQVTGPTGTAAPQADLGELKLQQASATEAQSFDAATTRVADAGDTTSVQSSLKAFSGLDQAGGVGRLDTNQQFASVQGVEAPEVSRDVSGATHGVSAIPQGSAQGANAGVSGVGTSRQATSVSSQAASGLSAVEVKAAPARSGSRVFADFSHTVDTLGKRENWRTERHVSGVEANSDGVAASSAGAAGEPASAGRDSREVFNDVLGELNAEKDFMVKESLLSNAVQTGTHSFNSLIKGQ